MNALRVCLFGSVRIAHDAWAGEVKVTRAVRSLLAFLLIHRHRMHPREVLAGLFWGDQSEERARSCLSSALWRLRQVLEPEGVPKETYLVTTSTGEVGFNLKSDHWLDVAVFEENVGPVLSRPIESLKADEASQIENALKLYQGELLEGFYDDWALRERERLRSLHIESLIHLMGYYRHHRAYEGALSCGKQILNLEPLREEMQREVMRLYVESGQRALAIKQYKACCKVLVEELDIPPMEETQALHHDILAGTDGDGSQPKVEQNRYVEVKTKTNTLQQGFQKLHHAMRGAEKSGQELQQAIRLLENLLKGRGFPMAE